MEPRTIKFASGTAYTLDRHGFLDPPDQWDEAFAEGLAETLGIYGGLRDDHWKLISYLRKKFIHEQEVPVVVFACVDNGLRLSKLRSLFPTGYHRGACKIAGINYAFLYNSNIWHTYESYTYAEAEHAVTPLGFLVDFDSWNERFASLVVKEWDLPDGLSDGHREVIAILRDRYAVTGVVPTVYETCKASGLDLASLRALFPAGYRRGACRAAGLPFVA
jgi:tRNA 2-thiouridine synthesizing protein E